MRLDGTGNIFTSLQRRSTTDPGALDSIVVYGFKPTATGSTAPTVQIAPTDGYDTFFVVN